MHLHCETSALDPPSEQSTLEPDVIDLQTVCTLRLMFAGRASPNHCTGSGSFAEPMQGRTFGRVLRYFASKHGAPLGWLGASEVEGALLIRLVRPKRVECWFASCTHQAHNQCKLRARHCRQFTTLFPKIWAREHLLRFVEFSR
jgi:hypothetical protein